MTVKLKDLIAELSPDDRKDVAERKNDHLRAMAQARRLPELRQGAGVRQVDVAQAMRVGQNAVSQLEARNDWQLSTLSRYVESIGYRLELALVDPNGDRMVLTNFRPWDPTGAQQAEKGRTRPRGSKARKIADATKSPARESAVAAKGRPPATRKR